VNSFFIFKFNSSILVIGIKYNIHGKYASNNNIFKMFSFREQGGKGVRKNWFRVFGLSGKILFGKKFIREFRDSGKTAGTTRVVYKTDSKPSRF